uniref:Cyclin-dependent kinase 5 activator 1 n=1 Tax=Astyanax mexicanus TaxID=7994 RepID=A0A3B1INV4_ASTMX
MCVELLTCFFVACSYIGTQLGYPAQPFMLERNTQDFWERTLDITKRMSQKMLLINTSPQFFSQFGELLYSGAVPSSASLPEFNSPSRACASCSRMSVRDISLRFIQFILLIT